MKILVIGAGIAGLAMARMLTRLKIDFDIVEKRSRNDEHGTGIALPFNAVRCLKQLDLYAPLMEKAHKVSSITYGKTNGSVLSRAKLTSKPFKDDIFVALLRKDLHSILMEGLEDKIEFACEATQFNEQKSSIEVHFNGSKASAEYGLVIAADGVYSAVRRHFEPQDSSTLVHPVKCWRFVGHLANHGLEPTYLFGKTDVFMAYPISADRIYGYAHVLADKTAPYHSLNNLEQLRLFFSDYSDPIPQLLAQLHVRDILPGRVVSVAKPLFHRRRVAFIGDASSACSPLLQQGAASAFEDVLTLGRCLERQMQQKGSIKTALSEYKNERSSRVKWIMNYSDKPYRALRKMNNPMISGLRNCLIRLRGPLNVTGWKRLAKMPGPF